MHDTPAPSRAPSPRTTLTAAIALALLIALSVAGIWLVGYARLAPSVPIPAQAMAGRYQTHAIPYSAPASSELPWGELKAAQQQALQPLADQWPHLSEAQKRQWLQLAQGFQALPAPEQERMQSHMAAWAKLSAQQRSQARLNYAVTNRLSREDLRAQWEAYQTLSDEEKKRLAAKASVRPRGAATAVRPIPSKKFVRIPARRSAPKPETVADTTPPPAAEILPPRPAVVIETTPIATPSASAAPLPALADDTPSEAPTSPEPTDAPRAEPEPEPEPEAQPHLVP